MGPSQMLWKVKIEKIYHFIFVRLICVHAWGKVIEQACQAATFASEAILWVTYPVVHLQVCD